VTGKGGLAEEDFRRDAVTVQEVLGCGGYWPKEIAERVENVGPTKANVPLLSQAALGVLAYRRGASNSAKGTPAP